jgi:tetratricopeptide (TPR) repeat protein
LVFIAINKPGMLEDLLADENHDGDDASVPTVMISAIEMIDNDSHADNLSVPPENLDGDRLNEEDTDFAALPLLDRALTMYTEHLKNNLNHQYVFNTKFLMAETYKQLGQFEEALELHESIFHLRRKHLGDQHFDTISSLVAIAETLRMMKKIYNVSKLGAVHKHSGMGTDDINLKDLSRIGGTITLQDHILALTRPTTSSKKQPYELDKTAFLTNLEDESNLHKKPKPLPIPKGYMGYAFPKSKNKNINRPSNSDGFLSAFGQHNNKVAVNPLHDVKKCIESAVTLLRKVLNKDDPIHSNNAPVIKKEGNQVFDHPLLATCLYNKSELSRLKGDYSSALKHLENCLTMRRKLYRSTHILISDCLYSMAMLLYQDQRYVQCIPLFTKALEIRLQSLHPEHPAVAEVYNSMSLLYVKLGDYPLAEEYMRHALDICNSSLPTQHPGCGNIYVNYAVLLQSLNRKDEALDYYRKALENKMKVFKDGHPEISNIYNNMATLFKHYHKPELALEYYEKAIDIQKKVLGENHPDVATTYNNMGSLLCTIINRRYEAKEYFKISLNIRMTCFGQEHVLVANTMNNYGTLLYELHEYKAAKTLFQDAYEIRKKIFNNNNFSNCHPALAESLCNLAYWEYNQGSLIEAIGMYEQALKMRKQIYPDKNATIATTLLQLSAAYMRNKNMKAAIEYAEEAYAMRLELLGDLNPDTIAAKKAVEYLQKKVKGGKEVQSLLQRMDDGSLVEQQWASPSKDKEVIEEEMQKSLFIGEEAMEM